MIENIQQIKNIINDSEAVLLTAGAGMGVDSGLPDFRGNEGFWKAYPPIKKLGLSFSDMANPSWFDTNPTLAWAFYGHRLNLYRDTKPHIGFTTLLNLVQQKHNNYFIFTSNVDGQFQKAGFDDEKIYEVHGSIHHMQCIDNCNNKIWHSDKISVKVDMDEFKALSIPLCNDCGNVSRPNILMFGDWEWNDSRSYDQQHKYNQWLEENRFKKISIIEIGAGTAIPTIRNEGEQLAKHIKDCTLIRINPRDFNINNEYGFSIPLGAVDGINSII